MRKFQLLLALTLCVGKIDAQIPKNAVSLEDVAFDAAFSKRKIPVVKGRLLNMFSAGSKKLTITYTLISPFSAKQYTKTAAAATDGSFKLQLEYVFPYQQIWLGVGENDLFYAGLYADTDLFVELDIKKIIAEKEVSFYGQGVRYLGTDGPLNTYMNKYVKYKRAERQDIAKRKNDLMYSRTPGALADIIPVYNQLVQEEKAIQDSYIAENPSPYGWLLENERMSEYYATLCPRYWNKEMDGTLWQKMKTHKSYLLSNDGAGIYSYMATYLNSYPKGRMTASWRDIEHLPDLTQEEKTAIDSLRMAEGKPGSDETLRKWLQKIQGRTQKNLLVKGIERSIRLIDSLFPDAVAKADYLKLQLNTSKDPIDQKMALEHIIPGLHTEWSKDLANAEYKRTLNKVNEINNTLSQSKDIVVNAAMPGKPVLKTSFGATLYKVSDMKAPDFLVKLKQVFRDKAIVLDLWATWCAPCLYEMPHSKKLLNETKDLPVVYVYLCTINSSTENKWKSKIAELKQPGMHFLIDETLDAELSKYFSWSGYPGYAFIDRKGIYKPGAIQRISMINKEAMADLLR